MRGIHWLFVLSIEANPSREGRNDVNLQTPKIILYQLIKNIAYEILPHIFSALTDLGMIFER